MEKSDCKHENLNYTPKLTFRGRDEIAIREQFTCDDCNKIFVKLGFYRIIRVEEKGSKKEESIKKKPKNKVK